MKQPTSIYKLRSVKKRSASSRNWLLRQLNDPYVQQARQQGYRSRAAFKLVEIQEKFKLLKRGQHVLDLGAAPGGWSQVLGERVTPGLVIGVDCQAIDPIPGVTLIQGDLTDAQTWEQIRAVHATRWDGIVSDMAPAACGIASVDHLRITELLELAWDQSKQHLKWGGFFIAKTLRSGAEPALLSILKQHFSSIHHFKPSSSRQDSKEMYLVARGFRESIGEERK